MKLFSQKTELRLDKNKPVSEVRYEIVFRFNDERALRLYRGYNIYYSSFDKLEDLKVYTVNPQADGKTKTIETKEFTTINAKRSEVFYDDQQEVDITFLGLTIGSEAHVEYKLTSSENHFTDPMYFRHYLPIEQVIFELTVPEDMTVSFIEKNIPQGLYQYTKDEKRKETLHHWEAHDVPEEKDYSDAPSRNFYSPFILYKIDSYKSHGIETTYSKSVDDLYAWYTHNLRKVNQTLSPELKATADSICHNVTNEVDKIKAIYDWVKSNIRYVAFEAGMEGLIPRNADVVCSKRYGDCKDMSSLQYGLMKAVGLQPHLTWIGTRDISFIYSEVPLKNSDNHMINAVKVNNQWIFLDATDPSGEYGLPSSHIQGKQALIGIDSNHYELVMVPVVSMKENAMSDTLVCTLEGNNLNVSNTSYYSGLPAGRVYNHLMYLTETEKEDYAKSVVKTVSNNAILRKHFVPEKSKIKTQPFKLDYTLPDYAKEAGKEKYVNLFLVKEWLNESITDAGRIAPVDYKYNFSNVSVYQFITPEGYSLDYVPADSRYDHPHFFYRIRYEKTTQGVNCIHEYGTNFPDLLMRKEDFESWNQMIKKLSLSYKESVVLKKTNP